MPEIGLAAAHYAEKAVEALQRGDMAAAIGALASIDEKSWRALQERLPGFPEPSQVAALSAAWSNVDAAVQELPRSPRILPGAVDAGGHVDVVTYNPH